MGFLCRSVIRAGVSRLQPLLYLLQFFSLDLNLDYIRTSVIISIFCARTCLICNSASAFVSREFSMFETARASSDASARIRLLFCFCMTSRIFWTALALKGQTSIFFALEASATVPSLSEIALNAASQVLSGPCAAFKDLNKAELLLPGGVRSIREFSRHVTSGI